MSTQSPQSKLFLALTLAAVSATPWAASTKKAEGAVPLKVERVLSTAKAKEGAPLEAAAKEADPYEGVVVHTVSTHDYTRLVLPEPIQRIYVADEHALQAEPEYLANNTAVLLLFAKTKSSRPLQLVIHYKSGNTSTFYVRPGEGPGNTITVPGDANQAPGVQRPGAAQPAPAARESVYGSDIKLLQSLVQGLIPEGMQPLPLPAPTVFDRFSVQPDLALTDGARNVYVFRLLAEKGQASVISPSQFYRPGVSAVMVDGDRLDPSNPRRVFLVENGNE